MDTHAWTGSVLGLSFLVWFYFGPWASLRRDQFRSDLRRVRDDLFDLMWKDGHDYATPAYRETREMINTMLRSSNLISLPQFLLMVWWSRHLPEECSERYPRTNDPLLQQKLEEARRDARGRMLVFLFLEGPWGFPMRMLFRLHAIRTMMAGWQRTFTLRGQWFIDGLRLGMPVTVHVSRVVLPRTREPSGAAPMG